MCVLESSNEISFAIICRPILLPFSVAPKSSPISPKKEGEGEEQGGDTKRYASILSFRTAGMKEEELGVVVHNNILILPCLSLLFALWLFVCAQ